MNLHTVACVYSVIRKAVVAAAEEAAIRPVPRVESATCNTLENAALRRQVQALESRLLDEPAILGTSPAARRLRQVIARVAPTNGRVLITGATGTALAA